MNDSWGAECAFSFPRATIEFVERRRTLPVWVEAKNVK
jgi:hypothetical protein